MIGSFCFADWLECCYFDLLQGMIVLDRAFLPANRGLLNWGMDLQHNNDFDTLNNWKKIVSVYFCSAFIGCCCITCECITVTEGSDNKKPSRSNSMWPLTNLIIGCVTNNFQFPIYFFLFSCFLCIRYGYCGHIWKTTSPFMCLVIRLTTGIQGTRIARGYCQ